MQQDHRTVVGPGDQLSHGVLCGGLFVIIPVLVGKAPKDRFITQFLGDFQIFLEIFLDFPRNKYPGEAGRTWAILFL